MVETHLVRFESSDGLSGCNWGTPLQLGHPVTTGTFRLEPWIRVEQEN
jgi:hypothetical protein